MSKIWKSIKLTLFRLFIDPCHKCVREGDCEMFRKGGYCGDWGLDYYEERTEDDEQRKTG